MLFPIVAASLSKKTRATEVLDDKHNDLLYTALAADRGCYSKCGRISLPRDDECLLPNYDLGKI